MMRLILPVCLLLLAGCTSLHLPGVRSDFYETQYRGAQALDGSAVAFTRLESLQQTWASRGARGYAYTLLPWDRRNRDRAAQLAEATVRVTDAHDAILSQRELTDVMVNALKDLESEYDSISALLTDSDAPAASLNLAAEQKYLARRMANSLALMSQSDMGGAVEASDVFGRDVARFQQLLDAALNGNEEMGIDPPDNPDVEDSLSQIEDLFTGYVADSANDVLENVVSRYDAWSALRDMTALGDSVYGGGVIAASNASGDGSAAAGDAAPAAGQAADDAASDAAVEAEPGDAGGEVENGAVEGAAPADDEMPAEDEMMDDGAMDDEPIEDEPVEEEVKPVKGKTPAKAAKGK